MEESVAGVDMTHLDEARSELASLWSAPTGEHVDTYERVHGLLDTALKAIDGL
ncbi:MAG TPA: hypothetical protein VMV52_03245 [Candidatus Nanopelagicaceae bacterium]|nr:hypothetical protein [Candidatus Nanopelagicaceae bacterium]